MADSPADAVKERVDIVALIGESLPLKRAGAHFKAKCPFHEEKEASFTVSPTRQTFRCFGCGENGDIFSWLMKREGMSFPEALRVLAQRAGVPLTFERPERREERERLRATLDLAATFYARVLLETTAGRDARAYLEGRGVAPESIQAWRLGFCPEAPTGIAAKARERGVMADDLLKAGVLRERTAGAAEQSDRTTTTQRSDQSFEFFHGRILFPLADAHGSVIGFAGRAYPEERPGSPKYMNTPETVLYRKSAVLYGLDRAKEAIRKENLAVLVEGYTDVIASHQAGVTNVVATAGTALTDEHLRLLRRFTDRLALAFDADAGGETATRRAIALALGAGCTVSVVLLPAGEDPADLAIADSAAWRAAVDDRRDVFGYLLERARQQFPLASPEGKRAAAADLLPLIAGVRDAVIQGDYVQQLAHLLGVDPRFVYEDLRRWKLGAGTWKRAGGTRTSPVSGLQSPVSSLDPQLRREERLLLLLLADAALMPTAAASLPDGAFQSPKARALYTALRAWYGQGRAPAQTDGAPPPTISLDDLRASLPDDLRADLDALLFALEVERERETEWDQGREARSLVRVLLLDHLRRELRARTEALARAPAAERGGHLAEIAAVTEELARAERMAG